MTATDGPFEDPAQHPEQIESKAQRIVRQCEATGEPYFVLRAKDIFSVPALKYYALQVERYGPTNMEFQESLGQSIEMFRSWEGDHAQLTRYPD